MKQQPLPHNDPFDERNYHLQLSADHPDYKILGRLASYLTKRAGGWDDFARGTSSLLRQAVDEVIDCSRTARFTVSETEEIEKAYLDTKIELLFRALLKLRKGRRLKADVDGIDVDIRNKMAGSWEIPDATVEHPCILIEEDEATAVCSVGLIVAHEEFLSKRHGANESRSIDVSADRATWWILRNLPYPSNPWELIPEDKRFAIMRAAGGSDRVAALFHALQDQPISRGAVQHVARQKDALKRVRRNGGARDRLAPIGIAILYGPKDRSLIEMLGLRQVGDGFISHAPRNKFEEELLRSAGHID